MVSWAVKYGPAPKAVVNAQLGSTTINDVTGFDPGPGLNRSDATLVSHFNAAIASAQAAVAALIGPATKLSIEINGYRDLNLTGKPYDSSSKITVLAMEVW